MTEQTPKRAYFDWVRMSWFVTVAAVALMGVSVWVMGSAAAPVLTTGIPAVLALAGFDAWRKKDEG